MPRLATLKNSLIFYWINFGWPAILVQADLIGYFKKAISQLLFCLSNTANRKHYQCSALKRGNFFL